MFAVEQSKVLDRRSIWVFSVCGALSLLFLVVELGLEAFLIASAIALLLLPFTAGIVLLMDRVQPEPRAVLGWTFCAGATAVLLLALVLNTGIEYALVPAVGDDTAGLLGGAAVAPVVEEGGKAAVLLLLLRRFRHQISGPLDGVIYAAAVGLGFATVEDVLYYGRAIGDGELVASVVTRGIISPLAHPLFTAFTGIGLGLMISGRTRLGWKAPALGFLVAVGLHALWNGSSSVAGGLLFLLVLPLVMLPALIALFVLCRKEARRERGLVRQHLAGEVATGLLAPGDLDTIAEVRPRRRLLKAVKQSGGDGRELVTTALALAEVRERHARNGDDPDAGAEAEVLTQRLAAARQALPAATSEAGLRGVYSLV